MTYTVEPAWRVGDAIFSSEAEARAKAAALNAAAPRRKRSGFVALLRAGVYDEVILTSALFDSYAAAYTRYPTAFAISKIEWSEPVA